MQVKVFLHITAGLRVFPAVERVFNKKLTTYEKLLAFDSYWEGYELGQDAPDMNESAFYWYEPAPQEWQAVLLDTASRAYNSLGGNGYGRIDMRTPKIDSVEGVMVLEVNANWYVCN